MASYHAGTGYIFISDSSGDSHRVGVIQDASIEINHTKQSLMGEKQFPVANFTTGKTITGKAKFAKVDGKLIAELLGVAATTGREIIKTNYTARLSGTVQVLPTGSGFAKDLGVWDANGNPMQVTASAPTVGMYSVNATGLYTFNTSDVGSGSISYGFNTGSGYTITVTNEDIGTTPTFTLRFQNTSPTGKILTLKLNAVTFEGINFTFGREDATMQDVSFEASADSSDNVYSLTYEN